MGSISSIVFFLYRSKIPKPSQEQARCLVGNEGVDYKNTRGIIVTLNPKP